MEAYEYDVATQNRDSDGYIRRGGGGSAVARSSSSLGRITLCYKKEYSVFWCRLFMTPMCLVLSRHVTKIQYTKI